MLQCEHSVILSTFIKLPFAIKIFILSIFEWPLKTGFAVKQVPEAQTSLHKLSIDRTITAHTQKVKA